MLQWSGVLSLYKLQALRIPHVTVEWSVMSLQSAGPAESSCYSGVYCYLSTDSRPCVVLMLQWSVISPQTPGPEES